MVDRKEKGKYREGIEQEKAPKSMCPVTYFL